MLLKAIIGPRFLAFLAVTLACLSAEVASAGPRYPAASPGAAVVADTNDETLESLCLMIESAAKANDLPLAFFARVIWQEGHFQVNTVGPQRERMITGAWPVLDPFDPVQALPKAAEFLSALHGQFGNLGLAAAAYHIGPERLQAWLAGTGAMPQETRDYVSAITGASVDDWAKAGRGARLRDAAAAASCAEMIAMFKTQPNRFVTELEQRTRQSATRPWGVQLAGGFDRDQALASYAREMRRLRPVIGNQDTTLLAGIFRSRGTSPFYQARIGADTRPVAEALCNRIRLAGGACFVLRNKGVQV
jgi:hypothetical protein